MKIFCALLVVLTMASFSSAQKPQAPADVIFINGDILVYTPHIELEQKTNPMARPQRAQALAISGDKVLAVDTNQSIQRFKGPKTQVVDLGGHFVMSGFN